MRTKAMVPAMNARIMSATFFPDWVFSSMFGCVCCMVSSEKMEMKLNLTGCRQRGSAKSSCGLMIMLMLRGTLEV